MAPPSPAVDKAAVDKAAVDKEAVNNRALAASRIPLPFFRLSYSASLLPPNCTALPPYRRTAFTNTT
jgi:hypothetical protein